MARIITVYTKYLRDSDAREGHIVPVDMSYIRWFKMSEALACRGHEVDMATNEFKWYKRRHTIQMGPNLRRVALPRVKWNDYDVVKTLFCIGFETLEFYGGAKHPFIISKLGSVVGPKNIPGVYFYGKMRKWRYAVQKKINKISRYITLLNEPSKQLWYNYFGKKENVLLVPGGVDRDIPEPVANPYPGKSKIICLFAGNVYTKDSQPEANSRLIDKLNKLGKLLLNYNVQLYLLGPGDVRCLDKKDVNYLGIVSYEKSWDYLRFAHVGVVLMAGEQYSFNESSKIYHYLRIGLPVVAESGFPNEHVIHESRLGFVVENGNLELVAEKIKEACRTNWNRDYAIEYILKNHTWDKRAEIYDKIINDNF